MLSNQYDVGTVVTVMQLQAVVCSKSLSNPVLVVADHCIQSSNRSLLLVKTLIEERYVMVEVSIYLQSNTTIHLTLMKDDFTGQERLAQIPFDVESHYKADYSQPLASSMHGILGFIKLCDVIPNSRRTVTTLDIATTC
jgi:hypothetical protein